MNQFIKRHKALSIIICIVLTLSLVAGAFILYTKNRVKLLDNTEFKKISQSIEECSSNGGFTDQASLRDFIIAWADENGLKYRVDNYDNIIFNTKAAARKKNVTPSVVCVSYNYETVSGNARLLASAAMIAKTELDSGRKTVIFVNDEQNSGKGYQGISKKYFSGKSKVIYMDYGSSAYLSCYSYGMNISKINIPAKKEKVSCDTGIKIHISGIPTNEINTNIADQPDPISAFSTLLTRLKSKSVTFQLADFEVASNGYMYPTSLDATIVLNSYSVESFTSYIDKRIKAWEKDYQDDYPDATYTYELIENPDALPDKAYTSATAEKLTNVLYTVKNGTYNFAETDFIPEDMSEGDAYGINCAIGLEKADDTIDLVIMTQAYNDDYMETIENDNKAAASLFKCSYNEIDSVKIFENTKKSLSHTFTKTFYKVNDISGANSVLKEHSDNCFTPCSYLSSKGSSVDIIHLRLNPKKAASLTNTILCYIETKGNFFSL